MTRARTIYALTAGAALLAAAAQLTNDGTLGALVAVCIGAAWLAAWKRGPDALVDLGLAALLATAALASAGGRPAAAVMTAGVALAAWDAMRAERAQRPFADAGERAAVDRTRTRFALLTAGGGMIAGLAALIVRTAVPAGALSFGALAALLLLSVALTALAMRREIVQRDDGPT
jgi:hypothetical protein